MHRRWFLRSAVLGVGTLAFGGSLWRDAFAAPAQPGESPYGPLLPADGNGIELPAGFTSRMVARSGMPVGATGYAWHPAPDGGACFGDETGWIYVSNSEVARRGGASAIRFRIDGSIERAYRILGSTNRNCAGGPTPWGRWLSCEEVARGRVFETDPRGVAEPVARLAMGRFTHEAAAVDPVRRVVYMTEDEPDGCFYRFRPASWPSLARGTLEVLKQSTLTGPVTWARVPAPSATWKATRYQVAGVKRLNGGEGCWYASGYCWFTTKGDNRVWRYDAAQARLDLAYDATMTRAPLTGVDNLTRSGSGDLFVAEDRGNMEICVITPDEIVAPFLRVLGQAKSELTGPAFSPDGTRLYFSSQRGTSGYSTGGITYEITGPFRSAA